jgi:hypothetical protein
MQTMSTMAKAITAAVAMLLGTLELALADSTIADLSLDTWARIAVATAGAFLAVYNIPNAKRG